MFRNSLRALMISAALIPASAYAQSGPAEEGVSAGSIEDIVVTARRRTENAQTVPVSITAFSGETLQQRGVRELTDINNIAPGFRFGAEGGKNTNNIILRGLAKIALGEGVPAVVTYFADVPLVGDGTNLPTYDIADIQVLKGPQGTLFGRNTLGGALLVKPQAPTYEFGGYVKGSYGRFDYRAGEGAINIPLVAEKVAVRVAGQLRRQDGVVKNLSGGRDFNDIHQDSFRVSLLMEPVEGLTNLTIFDYFKANENAGALYLYQHNPGVIPGLSALLDPQLAAYRAGQQGNFYGAYDGTGGTTRADRKFWSIVNDTKISAGDLTIRNIFGYRRARNGQTINTGGTGPLTFPVAPGVSVPFTLFTAASDADRSYLTNELQLLGDLADGKVDFILGGYYGKDKPEAPGGSNFIAFSATGAPQFSTSHVINKSQAVFGQVGYHLTDQLTANIGGRYSWDQVAGCGGSFGGTAYVSYATCKQVGAQNLIDGVGVIKTKGSAPSWTLGLDYKASDDLFLYVTSRRGYRGANINTPLFETAFTTGGAGCALGTAPVPCPDLRPFQKIDKETLTDIEAGSKWTWQAGGMRGRLNTAGFYGKYKNALQFFNVVATGIPQAAPDFPTRQSIGINAADLTIYGLELDASIVPTAGLTFSFNAAYTKTKIDKVSVPPIGGLSLTAADITKYTPRFASTLAVNWVVPVDVMGGQLSANADWYHTTKFGAQAGRNLPGYDVVNARIGLDGINGSGLGIALVGRNLFSEKYFISPSNLLQSFPTNTVYVGERSQWVIEARYRF